MNNMLDQNKRVREWSVIWYDEIRGAKDIGEEFSNFSCFEELKPGIIRPDAGTFRPNKKLFYKLPDNLSDEFTLEYGNFIKEYQVLSIEKSKFSIKEEREKKPIPKRVNPIISLLPLSSNAYASLTKEELKAVGNEYYSIEEAGDEYKIKPTIMRTKKNYYDELFVKIGNNLSEEILEKIENEIIEFTKSPSGNFKKNEETIEQKRI